MKRRILLRAVLLLLPQLFFSLLCYGQTMTVKGVVTSSSDGLPIVGVNIIEVGTTNGTITDVNGNYQLTTSQGKELEFSFIGFASQRHVVSSSELNVVLEDEALAMGEVVVIGYGTARRSDVTGSIASVSSDELRAVPSTDITYALQGRVAGVDMTQTESKPGANMQIRIRGQRSLSASNDPLIVLDGIPFMGSLSDINPNDIKSMDILKDASSTAIYGSRGANGVIIITTVKGKKEQPAQFSYNGYVGAKTLFARYPMMNGEQLSKMRKLAGKYTNGVDEKDGVDTDWQDMLYTTGIVNSHDVSVTGGTTGGAYSFGGGYYHDEAVVPGQSYDRFTLKASVEQEIREWFKLGLTTNSNYNVTKGSHIGLYNVLAMSPLVDPYNADGTMKERVQSASDTYWVMTKDVIEKHEDLWINEKKAIGTYNNMFVELSAPFLKGLKYRMNLGLNYRSSKQGSFTGVGVNSTEATAPSSASLQHNEDLNWAVENLLTYDNTFADVHSLNVVAMYSAEQTTKTQSHMSGKDIPNEFFQYYNIGRADGEITVNPNYQNYEQTGLVSWMGRVMYSYDNKYMLAATVRSDASSRLAEGHKWHTYPAFSLGWNIKNESFMEDITWLDILKIRVGYGQTSNQAVAPYSTLGELSTRPYNFGSETATGYYVSKLPNPELGWEFSTTMNYGLDFTLFNGRVSGTAEVYTQKTEDILLSVNLPSTSGVSSYVGNIGKTENKGFELSMNGTILEDVAGFTWDFGFNMYLNRNKLTELASGADRDEGNGWFVGHPIDVIYDYEKIGIWQIDDKYRDILEPGGNAGMIKVKYTGDYNADGSPVRAIGADDRQIISMEAKLQGGFNTRLAWKGLDLSVIGAFKAGGKLISSLHSSSGYLNMLTGRRGNVDVDYWTPENPGGDNPLPGGIQSGDNPKYGSTLGYFDASYVKIRTITLGYNLDSLDAIKNLGISRLRAYFTIQNPFVIYSPYTKECGLDPEPNSFNDQNVAVSMKTGSHSLPIVGTNSPATRNFIFGLNFTF